MSGNTILFSSAIGDIEFPMTPDAIDGMAIGVTTPAPVHATTLNASGAASLAAVSATTIDSSAGMTTTSLASSGNARRSTDSGVTAHAGGGRTSAYAIAKDITEVATAASVGDSVVLPASLPGMCLIIVNGAANAIQVFANGTDTIDTTAGATGVSQAAAAKVAYICYAAGLWITFKSA